MRAPVGYGDLGGGDIIVGETLALRAAQAHTIMGTGVDQCVVQHQIAVVRQRRKDRHVASKAAIDEQSGLRAKEIGGLTFEQLMLGVITTQQA